MTRSHHIGIDTPKPVTATSQTKVLMALSGLEVNVDGPEMTSPEMDTPPAAAGEKSQHPCHFATRADAEDEKVELSLRFFGEEETVC
jgi:hypothetical protein